MDTYTKTCLELHAQSSLSLSMTTYNTCMYAADSHYLRILCRSPSADIAIRSSGVKLSGRRISTSFEPVLSMISSFLAVKASSLHSRFSCTVGAAALADDDDDDDDDDEIDPLCS